MEHYLEKKIFSIQKKIIYQVIVCETSMVYMRNSELV